MFPIVVAALFSFGGWCRRFRITIEPFLNHVVIVLLGPKQSAKCLAHYCSGIVGKIRRDYGLVEFICFVNAIGKGRIEVFAEWTGGR